MDYGKKYNVKIDEEFALLKLYEEVGELAQAVLIHKKKPSGKICHAVIKRLPVWK